MNYVSSVNIALCHFLHNNGNIATERSPKPGLYSTRMTSRALHSAQYHRQHYTLHAFWTVWSTIQKLDDEHLTQPRFEPSTSVFRATTGRNEPSVPVNIILSAACIS